MKKGVLLVTLVVILLLMSAIAFGCTNLPELGMGAVNKVAVISLDGPIQSQASSGLFFGGSSITPQLVRSQLGKAKNDYAVKAVVLQIESPGGSVAACQEILNNIDNVEKPIVVSFGTLAASGGYYIATKANKIVALPGTLTGSIGVISELPNLKGLYEKLGIKIEVFTAGKYKDMYAGVRDMTSEEQELMQSMTNRLYDQFVKAVADGRGLSEAEVRELATGQLYTGEQAKELGLVDELGGLDRAIELAAELAGIGKPQVEYYQSESPSLLRSLLDLGSYVPNFVQTRLLGVEGIIILRTLNNPYPQPEYR